MSGGVTETEHRLPGQFEYDGMVFAGQTSPEMLDRVKTFEFRDEDLLLATFVKSGTTWMSYILSLIQNNGNDVTRGRLIFDMHPYVEFCRGMPSAEGAMEALDSLPSPRTLVTHLPAEFFQSKVRQGNVKVIVVIRNPKDTLVSLFHFYRMSKPMGKFQGSWDDFFGMFRDNRLWSGNVIEHNATWWRLRDLPNVLAVTFEEMKGDPAGVVRRVAEFTGRDLSEQTVDQIVRATTFQQLKQNPSTNREDATRRGVFDASISTFMRKGEVGDWKNYFSDNQSEFVDKMCEEMVLPLGLQYQFE